MPSYISTNGSQITINGAIMTVADFASLPASAADGQVAITLDTDVLYAFNTGSMMWVECGGSGTVTSVAMSVPASLLSVAGSPITTTGTLAVSLAVQNALKVFAGPNAAGPDAAPTFRALVAADIPAISLTTGVTGTLPIANGGTGQTAQTAAFNALSPITTKGDLISKDASDNVRLPVGSDGQVLSADSGEATGLKWIAAPGGSLPSDGGVADQVLTTNGSDVASFKKLGDIWSFQHIVFYDPNQFASEQAAIDLAATYPDADAEMGFGVAVIFPAGDFTNIEINNNIFVIGQGVETAFDNIVIRPGVGGADADTPRFAGIANLYMASSTLSAYSSDAVFNENFMYDADHNLRNEGCWIEGCVIDQFTTSRINFLQIRNCRLIGNQTHTYSEQVIFENPFHQQGNIDWHVDDSAMDLPATYSGGNLSFYGGKIAGVTLTRDGGVITAYFASLNTGFLEVDRTGNVDIRVEGGYIKALVDTNSANAFLNDDYPKRVHSGVVSVTVSTLAAGAEEDISVTVSGIKAGDSIQITPNNSAMETGLGVVACWVSANDTVKIRATNLNAVAALSGSTSDWTYLWTQITPDWSA